jgi:hypothetical protein
MGVKCHFQQYFSYIVEVCDRVYQLLAHGRWFSPASSTTKTGRHDIAEILLKVALKHQKIKINQTIFQLYLLRYIKFKKS